MDFSAIAVSVELAPVYVIKEYGIDLAPWLAVMNQPREMGLMI